MTTKTIPAGGVAPPDVAGRTVYVDRRGVRISVRAGRLVVSTGEPNGEILLERPLHLIDTLAITGDISITTPLVRALARNGTDLFIMTSHGVCVGRLTSPASMSHGTVQAQLLAHSDEARSLDWAKRLVHAKVASQHVLLRRRLNKRHTPELERVVKRLRRVTKLVARAESPGRLLGLEGAAARLYFGAFPSLIRRDSELTFNGRSRRPPADPVNAVLSFVYALLQADVEGACILAGLLPEAGLLHRGPAGSPCVVFDLMEPFRPAMADVVTLRLVNRRMLRPRHFEKRNDGVYLQEDGRKIVYGAWSERRHERTRVTTLKKPLPWHRVPAYDAQRLAAGLREDAPVTFTRLR